MRFQKLVTLICLTLLGPLGRTVAQDRLSSFALREGVFNYEPDVPGWKFRSGADSELFDLSFRGLLSKDGGGRIEGLRSGGVKLESGQVIHRIDIPRGRDMKDPPKARQFYTETGQVVELEVHKPTQVVRLEVRLEGHAVKVLWQVPNQFGLEGMDKNMTMTKDDQALWSVKVCSGTLEVAASPGRGYLFESVASGRNEAREAKEKLAEIPGMREIGFILDNGVEFFYENREGTGDKSTAVRKALTANPGHRLDRRIFEGEAKSRLEVAVKGETQVFRTNLEIAIGGDPFEPRDIKYGKREITVWTNRAKSASSE